MEKPRASILRTNHYIAGHDVTWMRNKRRKKSLALFVTSADGVEVRTPMRASLRDVHKMVENNTHWIVDRQQKWPSKPENILPATLIDKDAAKGIFEAAFMRSLPKMEQLGISHSGEFRIRNMKTRWGSCTYHGKITLNQKLASLPKMLIDYVVFHELCHLKEMNHGKRFYALLEAAMPDYKTHQKALKAYSLR